MKSRIPRTLTAVALGVAATLAVAQPTGAARPAAATAAVGPYVKVGYFTQWGIYRRNFLVKNLHTSGIAGKVTHINYAFGNVGVDGRCFEANESGQGDAWADYQKRFRASESVDGVADVVSQPLAGNFNQLRKLKAMYPGLQVQMSLGGWTWSKYFSDAALTPASRQAFVASCIDLFIKGNLPIIGTSPHGGPGSGAGVFDGIDVDWEWPASEGNTGNVVRPEDKQNFTALLAELRRDRGGERLHVPRLRHHARVRPAWRLGADHQPPVPAVLAGRRPDAGPVERGPGRAELPRRRRARGQVGHRHPVLRPRLDRRDQPQQRSLPAGLRSRPRHLRRRCRRLQEDRRQARHPLLRQRRGCELALRRTQLLVLRRHPDDRPEDRLHQGERAGRHDGLVVRRR